MWQIQPDGSPVRRNSPKGSSETEGLPAAPRPSTATWIDPACSWTAHCGDGAPRLTLRFTDPNVTEAEPELLSWLPPTEFAPLESEEIYARGDDLIASYAASASPFRQQIYWRHLQGVLGMEVIFSLQNQELQGAPVARIRSQLPATQVGMSNRAGQFELLTLNDAQRLPIPDGWIAVPLPHGGVYLEQLHPTDFRMGSVGVRNGLVEIVWELFGDPIEKGVIRRARARGELLVQADFNPELLAERRAQFAGSPIPLTT